MKKADWRHHQGPTCDQKATRFRTDDRVREEELQNHVRRRLSTTLSRGKSSLLTATQNAERQDTALYSARFAPGKDTSE